MPQGVYPAEDVCAIGDQISSTGEGRHVTLYGDNLSHGTNVSYVTKGYPVWFGASGVGVGMPFDTQTAALGNPLMAIDTEGIWCVDVHAAQDAGDVAVAPGDRLYVNTTTGVVSKINNIATQIPFGYALGNVTSGETNRIAVKVHFDPSLDTADTMYKTVTSGAYNYGKQWIGLLEAGQSTGVAGYFCAQIDGQQDGGIYGWGCWVEPQAGFLHLDNALLVLGEFGIYEGTSLVSDNEVVGLQLQYILAGAPDSIHHFRVNVAAAGGAMTAIFWAANQDSIGFTPVVTQSDAPIGYIPFASIVGVNGFAPVYVRVYADTD